MVTYSQRVRVPGNVKLRVTYTSTQCVLPFNIFICFFYPPTRILGKSFPKILPTFAAPQCCEIPIEISEKIRVNIDSLRAFWFLLSHTRCCQKSARRTMDYCKNIYEVRFLREYPLGAKVRETIITCGRLRKSPFQY